MIVIRKKIRGVSAIALSRFAAKARRAAGLDGEVTVLLASSEEIRDLNRRFRHKDKTTDVLSFPSEHDAVSGDIAISADIARENGVALGHGALTEVKVLILHGMLHLAGYDHESDNGEMAKLEGRLRSQLGLPHGLIERTDGGSRRRRV